LASDQIQKQIEGPLECLEKDLERMGWNVEIARQLRDRFAGDDGEGHLALCYHARLVVERRRDHGHQCQVRLSGVIRSL
jgi:hypothetical protein